MKARYVLAAGLVALTGLGLGAQQALQSGLDRSTFDTSVRPQDDLFRHVNGAWLTRTEIPADRATYGTFVQLTEQAETDLAEIIQGTAKSPNRPAGSNAQLIGDLYASFMDEAALNSLGASPAETSSGGSRCAEDDGGTGRTARQVFDDWHWRTRQRLCRSRRRRSYASGACTSPSLARHCPIVTTT